MPARKIIRVKLTDEGYFRDCSRCRQWKPQTEEHFYIIISREGSHKGRKHLFQSECRECSKLAKRNRRKEQPDAVKKQTNIERSRRRDRRWKALEVLKDIQQFLKALPTMANISDSCNEAKRLKQLVDLYVLSEDGYVQASRRSLKRRQEAQRIARSNSQSV